MERNSTYSFKRSFFYEVQRAIDLSSLTFVLGPRKCGKTVCMHQLESTLENAVYVDMKADYETDSEKRNAVNHILQSIANNDRLVFLIDEATYMAMPDKDIAKIAGAFSEYDNRNTKIVFAGSQSKALEFWGHIACGGNAQFIRTGFLSYAEWLAYKGTTNVTEETYIDFLLNSRDFYKDFSNTKEYLQGCLDETVISNSKSVEYVMGNSTEDLNVEMLLDVMYASLVKLHNHANYQSFSNSKLLQNMISYHFGSELSEVETKRALEILNGRYRNFKAMDSRDCKTAMQFLTNCGLATLTYVSDQLTADPYITDKLLSETSELYTKPQVFSRFNITVNYPMFYVDLVKDILKDRQISELPKSLLGSITECHVRSLLPNAGAFEYRSIDGQEEIDYVSNQGLGIEISVSNKRMRAVNLDKLPDSYRKILLTKDAEGVLNGIERIPYYRFVYEHSEGRELVRQLTDRNKRPEKAPVKRKIIEKQK